MSSTAPTPRAIAEFLGSRVLGQEEAVREMSVAMAKKLAGIKVGNVLMIGSSGTGKTTLMRAVEAYFASDSALARGSSLIRLHANVLGEEAAGGRPGEVVLRRLLERAREQLGAEASLDALLERATHGVCFVDEVDKIRSTVGDRPNIAGIRAQEALLTLMENEAVPLRLPEELGGRTVTVDSRDVLFVCGGAFEGLHDGVFDRVTIGRDKGALQATTVVEGGKVEERLIFHLRDWLRDEDLFEYGMTPQFLARFDAVVLLRDLGVDELVAIFLDNPDSAYVQSRGYFASRGIHLALSPDAVRRIAEAAARRPRLGARALKEIFRRVIRDDEFDPDARVQGGALLIDVAEVDRALGPKSR